MVVLSADFVYQEINNNKCTYINELYIIGNEIVYINVKISHMGISNCTGSL